MVMIYEVENEVYHRWESTEKSELQGRPLETIQESYIAIVI
jgi:hypothetical protein